MANVYRFSIGLEYSTKKKDKQIILQLIKNIDMYD